MFDTLATIWPKSLRALAIRFDRRPIDTVEALGEFVRTRASYVAQTSLYGYLKTRMGTSFPKYFEDAVFSSAMRTAAVKLFVSCLGDLTIYAVALTGRDRRLGAAQAAALARQCFNDAMERHLADLEAGSVPPSALGDFARRSGETLWLDAANGTAAFTGSERDIVRFAPVIDEFKALDGEIVSNSIRFRWRDIREQLRRRIDPGRISADWLSRSA
jgi:hypothetical protein